MSSSFLTCIQVRFGDEYAGDEYGGAGGKNGNGLPTGAPGNFMFATGNTARLPSCPTARCLS